MRIVKAPAEILTKKAKPVTRFDKNLQNLVSEMTKTLKSARDPEGVGLAATQVGVSKRIFVMSLNPDKHKANSSYIACINPKIIAEFADEKNSVIEEPILEGCLSVENTWGYPDRKHKIKLKYQDETGKTKTKILSGFPAIIAQHEIDHLNGILFTRRVLEQKKQLYRIQKDIKTEEQVLIPLEL